MNTEPVRRSLTATISQRPLAKAVDGGSPDLADAVSWQPSTRSALRSLSTPPTWTDRRIDIASDDSRWLHNVVVLDPEGRGKF